MIDHNDDYTNHASEKPYEGETCAGCVHWVSSEGGFGACTAKLKGLKQSPVEAMFFATNPSQFFQTGLTLHVPGEPRCKEHFAPSLQLRAVLAAERQAAVMEAMRRAAAEVASLVREGIKRFGADIAAEVGLEGLFGIGPRDKD